MYRNNCRIHHSNHINIVTININFSSPSISSWVLQYPSQGNVMFRHITSDHCSDEAPTMQYDTIYSFVLAQNLKVKHTTISQRVMHSRVMAQAGKVRSTYCIVGVLPHPSYHYHQPSSSSLLLIMSNHHHHHHVN